MAYSNQLGQKLLPAADLRQFSQVRLAEIFGASLSWVKRVLRRRRQTGSSELLPFAGGARPKISDEQRNQVRHYVLADPDATWREIQRWLQTVQSIHLSLPTLSRLLAKLNLPRKKSLSTPQSATGRRISRSEKPGANRWQNSIRLISSLSMRVV
jgi:transposase